MSGWKVGVVTHKPYPYPTGTFTASVERVDDAGRVIETAFFEDVTSDGALRSRDRFLHEAWVSRDAADRMGRALA